MYLADIIADFQTEAKVAGCEDEFIEALKIYQGVELWMIELFFENIEAEYETIDRFLAEAVGLTEEEIQSLRGKYTKIRECSHY
ncbi:MAG: tyrosine-protein phosphatase [Synergistaceae bacterium]|jgi:hypothetical protein|nr:tyrosine-protein phosphatase [Synergistaceae bacterium]